MTTTHANADEISEDTTLEMLKASDINIDQQIIRLKKQKAPKQKINALTTQHENIKSKITKIEDKKAEDEKAKQEAEKQAQLEKQEEEQKVKQEAEKQAQIDAQKKQLEEEQKAKQAQETNKQDTKPNTGTSVSSTEPIKQIIHNGLDMNQTTGTVNIPALGDWLEQNKGTFTSAQWQNIIRRESMGRVDIQNSSSGAYGVLQLLGHGEYRGMTLGEQLQMAMPLPASAWAQTAY